MLSAWRVVSRARHIAFISQNIVEPISTGCTVGRITSCTTRITGHTATAIFVCSTRAGDQTSTAIKHVSWGTSRTDSSITVDTTFRAAGAEAIGCKICSTETRETVAIRRTITCLTGCIAYITVSSLEIVATCTRGAWLEGGASQAWSLAWRTYVNT